MKSFILLIIIAVIVAAEAFITLELKGGDLMLILFSFVDAALLIYLNEKINIK